MAKQVFSHLGLLGQTKRSMARLFFLGLAATAAATDCVVSGWNDAYSTIDNGFCSSSSYYTGSLEDAADVSLCRTKCSDEATCAGGRSRREQSTTRSELQSRQSFSTNPTQN